jgi:hypothetical protein
MLSKKLAIAAAALLVSAPALAHPPHWAPAYGWKAKHHRPVIVVAPRPYYVAPAYYPAPVYYYPAPVYRPAPVYHPAPMYYPAPAPVSPTLSIGIRLPL